MGARGTQFYSAISSVKGHKGDLWMCVHEGEVEIENTKTHHKEIVKEGEGVALPRGKEITAPKPFEWTKNLNWAMDPSSKDLVNRASFESEYAKDILNQEYD
jgi:ferric-dicitrate binding protein FerR (iron transport regulator)